MSAADYLINVIEKYRADSSDLYVARLHLEPIMRSWANQYFIELKDSGSMAKGTSLNVNSDIDFLVSIGNVPNMTLKDIFNSLLSYLKSNGFPQAKAQNVSINLKYMGKSIDVSPAQRHPGIYTNDHSLYLSRQDTWRKTNIDEHINLVRNSYRTNEIKLAKIWRYNNNIEFPSLLIEVMSIEALQGFHGDISQNFWRVLEFIRDNIMTRNFYDPGNTNNNLSDLLAEVEKQLIRNKAIKSLGAQYWSNIVW
jgi:hypothetical protein